MILIVRSEEEGIFLDPLVGDSAAGGRCVEKKWPFRIGGFEFYSFPVMDD